MTIPYNPTTDDGTGFLVPIVKAMSHLHIVTVATGYEWPINAEVARGNLDHAIAHLDGMADTEQIISKPLVKHIKDWRNQLTALRDSLQHLEGQDPEATVTKDNLEGDRDRLKVMEQQTWALLALLDQDLLGWNAGQTDAGRNP